MSTSNVLFQHVVAAVMGPTIEGGFSNDPNDPGGPTNHGISLRFALSVGDLDADGHPDLDVDGDGDIDIEDIRRLSSDVARDLYYHLFWQACRCDHLPAPLACVVFDAAVNQGRGPAIVMLQQALGVLADGKIGPITLGAAERQPVDRVLSDYLSRRAMRYTAATTFSVYGRGWFRRLFEIARVAHALQRA